MKAHTEAKNQSFSYIFAAVKVKQKIIFQFEMTNRFTFQIRRSEEILAPGNILPIIFKGQNLSTCHSELATEFDPDLLQNQPLVQQLPKLDRFDGKYFLPQNGLFC